MLVRRLRPTRCGRKPVPMHVPPSPGCLLAYQAAVAATQPGAEALQQHFGVLDSRIAKVGRTAAHVGDRLSAVDAARSRAEEAADLISALALFDCEGPPTLGPLFTDDARLADAVALTPRLLHLAEAGAGSGLASCARAREQLQAFATSLETRLVARFDAGQQARDTAAMAQAAALLTSFNGGAAAVARFVATRPMFLTLGPGDGASSQAARPETEAAACDAAAAAVRSLGAQFKELLRGAKEEAGLVAAVFPSPGAAMATLVQRLLEQRVRGALDAAMDAMPGGESLSRPRMPVITYSPLLPVSQGRSRARPPGWPACSCWRARTSARPSWRTGWRSCPGALATLTPRGRRTSCLCCGGSATWTRSCRRSACWVRVTRPAARVPRPAWPGCRTPWPGARCLFAAPGGGPAPAPPSSTPSASSSSAP